MRIVVKSKTTPAITKDALYFSKAKGRTKHRVDNNRQTKEYKNERLFWGISSDVSPFTSTTNFVFKAEYRLVM